MCAIPLQVVRSYRPNTLTIFSHRAIGHYSKVASSIWTPRHPSRCWADHDHYINALASCERCTLVHTPPSRMTETILGGVRHLTVLIPHLDSPVRRLTSMFGFRIDVLAVVYSIDIHPDASLVGRCGVIPLFYNYQHSIDVSLNFSDVLGT